VRYQKIPPIQRAWPIYWSAPLELSNATIYAGRHRAATSGRVSAQHYPNNYSLRIADGYDLPPALKDWLYPTNGTTRDFATLQVVFGRGEEYFASDKNGKLEHKEPEVKKPVEEEEKVDKPALRRARTVSFLRPLSDVSTRSDSVGSETGETRWSSSTASRRASRPPSLSFSRTNSAASMFSEPVDLPSDSYPPAAFRPSLASQWDAPGSGPTESTYSSKRMSRSFEPPLVEPISEELAHVSTKSDVRDRSQSTAVETQSRTGFEVPEGYMLVPIGSAATKKVTPCTCGCHEVPLPQRSRPTYTDAGLQTDALSSPPRTALRIDTVATSKWSPDDYSALSQAGSSPPYDDYPAENPISMGNSMTSYFSNPGYQLGDSLSGSYQVYHPLVYQYQDEFGEEALR
jgi:hypothetical protein